MIWQLPTFSGSQTKHSHLRDCNTKANSSPLMLCSRSGFVALGTVLLGLSLHNKGAMVHAPTGAAILPLYSFQYSPDGRISLSESAANQLVSRKPVRNAQLLLQHTTHLTGFAFLGVELRG